MNTSTQTITVAEFITDRLKCVDKTHREIALKIGFENANVISMIAGGTLKLPIKRVAAMAKALNTDPIHLLRLVLTEYTPEVLEALENVLKRPLLSANEIALVAGFREVTGDRNASGIVVEQDGLLEVIVLKAA